MEVDVEDYLALDDQLTIEEQTVEGVSYRPLDGVLDGEKAELDAPILDRLEHIVQRAQGHDLGFRVIRLGKQRLFGKGSLGSEESDTQGCSRGHTQAG